MHLCGVLVLLTTLSAACGLRCYSCTAAKPESCTDTTACSIVSDRCYSLAVQDIMVTKGCLNSAACISPFSCCEGDLCNSAGPTGPGITLLLLLSSALFFFFI
uniref:Chromosome 2 SCAF15004, whole genome shotgun sequence, Uncharacterized protein n=1 Tax=Iconisemion striatum TaxID=60296 RepID=A0A1A7WWB8_9TELE